MAPRTTMAPRNTTRLDTLVDFIDPFGAVVLICFSLGSIWFNGGFHVSAGVPHHVLKTAYRTAVMPDLP
jgi:hypothetical protein